MCGVMDFPILHQDLKTHAAQLLIEENPSPEKLLDRLLKSPPTSKAKGQKVFEYLYSIQANFLDDQWTALRTANFIPLDNGKDMVAPQSCFFYKEDLPFQDFLTTVDFGRPANLFLKACGVKEEPSPIDLAQLVVRSPERFFQYEGVDKYRWILRQIANQLDVIKANKSLVDELKQSPFLLGEERINQDHDEVSPSSDTTVDRGQGAGSSHTEPDDSMDRFVRHRLAPASDIFLVDDGVLKQIFSPLCAPVEEQLELLYEFLGSTWISKRVKDTYKPIGDLKKTDRSYALQARIKERAPLLLKDHPADRLHFKQDWLTTKLMVLEVPKIELCRTFVPTGDTKLEATTACVVQDDKQVYYLLVMDQVDLEYFDIADALTKLLLKKRKPNDSVQWANLLSSNLDSLKRMGFKVDRILNAKNTEKAIIEIEKARIEAEKARVEAEKAEKARVEAEKAENDERAKIEAENAENAENTESARIKPEEAAAATDTSLTLSPSGTSATVAVGVSNLGSHQSKEATMAGSPSSGHHNALSGPVPLLPQEDTSRCRRFCMPLFNRSKSKKKTAIEKLAVELAVGTIQGATSTGKQTSNLRTPTSISTTSGHLDGHQRHLEMSLRIAIINCRPYKEGDVRSESTISQVPETHTNMYCDSKPVQSLKPAGHAGELSFYIHKDCNKDHVKTRENRKSLTRFAELLILLAKDVFGLKPESLHVMYDMEGPTIAFNRGGSLFFNWRFYVNLGHDDGEGSAIKRMQGQQPVKARDEGLIYWFFTVAHGLAHNIVPVHDSKHQYYMSSFCEQFFPAFMAVMASLS